jgi:hypothetical protein
MSGNAGGWKSKTRRSFLLSFAGDLRIIYTRKYNHKTRSSDAFSDEVITMHDTRNPTAFSDNVRWFSPPFFVVADRLLQIVHSFRLKSDEKSWRLNRKSRLVLQLWQASIVNAKHENLSQCAEMQTRI